MREPMTVLRLQGVVAGTPSIALNIESIGEVWIWSVINVSPHQSATDRPDVRQPQNVISVKTLLSSSIPLIGSRQYMMRIYNRYGWHRWFCCEWRRGGANAGQRKRDIERPGHLLQRTFLA